MNDRVRRLEASTDFAEEMLVAEIQSVLEDLLDQKGYSRADLAKKMGVTKARVTQIFSDTQNFTVRLIARAFHALGERVVVGHRSLSDVETKTAKEMPAQAHYLVSCPVNHEMGRSAYQGWRDYGRGVLVASWPESHDVAEALVSYIETQMVDPPRARKRDAKFETPKSVSEWIHPANVLPFRKERACA